MVAAKVAQFAPRGTNGRTEAGIRRLRCWVPGRLSHACIETMQQGPGCVAWYVGCGVSCQ